MHVVVTKLLELADSTYFGESSFRLLYSSLQTESTPIFVGRLKVNLLIGQCTTISKILF